MNGNFRLGSLFGIPFLINASWFLVLALVTWRYGSGLATQFPALGPVAPWILGLGTALLLFGSVLAHELGHSLVALRQGIGVQSITLFLFGGLASLEKEASTPGGALAIAIAGPAVSLGLWGLLTLGGVILPLSGPIAAIVSLLAILNLFLGLFNLIPGLPLDGGNVLKAIIWKLTGSPYKGTRIAGRVGQAFGWLAILSFIVPLLIYGQLGSIWNLLIGSFVLQNAGRAAQSANIQERLSRFTAADAVTPDSPIVPAQQTLRAVADHAVLNQAQWQRYLVVNEARQLVGILNLETLKAIPPREWELQTVADIMETVSQPKTVQASQSLLEVLTLLEQEKLSTLAVIQESGSLIGLLEKATVFQLLQQQMQPA